MSVGDFWEDMCLHIVVHLYVTYRTTMWRRMCQRDCGDVTYRTTHCARGSAEWLNGVRSRLRIPIIMRITRGRGGRRSIVSKKILHSLPQTCLLKETMVFIFPACACSSGDVVAPSAPRLLTLMSRLCATWVFLYFSFADGAPSTSSAGRDDMTTTRALGAMAGAFVQEAAKPGSAQPQPLKVISAGLGRTGTSSLKNALRRLGLKPYHMADGVFETEGHFDLWMDYTRTVLNFTSTTVGASPQQLIESFSSVEKLLQQHDSRAARGETSRKVFEQTLCGGEDVGQLMTPVWEWNSWSEQCSTSPVGLGGASGSGYMGSCQRDLLRRCDNESRSHEVHPTAMIRIT